MSSKPNRDTNRKFLLMHGAGLGGWIWETVIPELEAPAEAMDLPGRGGESAPRDVTLQECIDVASARARPNSILIGHSFSAEVALGVAATRPDAVAAVVLVSGVVPESGRSFMSLLPLPQRLFLHAVIPAIAKWCETAPIRGSGRVLQRSG